MGMHPKDETGMENSAGPDHTIPELGLPFAQTYLSQHLEFYGIMYILLDKIYQDKQNTYFDFFSGYMEFQNRDGR